MITHTHYANLPTYLTKDNSTVRELLHPTSSATRNQSLAEAIVKAGDATLLHCHLVTEEIYHITQGQGLMRLGETTFKVVLGDSIVIAPGTPHNIANTGNTPLKILCASSPAYSHDDTILLPG